jgi:hypothetical protein
VYYEGENHVGYLRKLWAKGSSTTRDDYDALRVDSAHMLSYPTRQFGFLTVIPRAGFRGTFYSQTVRRETVAEVREVVTTNTPDVGPPQIETRTVTNRVERDAEAGPGFRPLFEVGCETSFKAFGVWTEGETLFGRGLRHVVSPYANYTLVPRPGLTPSETCQFDEIDALGQDHSVRLGLVNELQTRRPDLLNLVYLDTYTTYRFVGAAGEPFGDLHWDAEFHFLDDLSLRTDGGFNVYHGVFDVLDFRALYAPPRWRAGVEYRFRDDSMSLLSGSLSVSPIRGWTFEAAGRYEFEGGRLEEHSYGITRTLDCMVIHSGLRHIPAYTRSDGSRREDEFRVEFQLWLTAFPDVRLAIRSRD